MPYTFIRIEPQKTTLLSMIESFSRLEFIELCHN